jgi:hypothetical protein
MSSGAPIIWIDGICSYHIHRFCRASIAAAVDAAAWISILIIHKQYLILDGEREAISVAAQVGGMRMNWTKVCKEDRQRIRRQV